MYATQLCGYWKDVFQRANAWCPRAGFKGPFGKPGKDSTEPEKPEKPIPLKRYRISVEHSVSVTSYNDGSNAICSLESRSNAPSTDSGPKHPDWDNWMPIFQMNLDDGGLNAALAKGNHPADSSDASVVRLLKEHAWDFDLACRASQRGLAKDKALGLLKGPRTMVPAANFQYMYPSDAECARRLCDKTPSN